LDSRNIKLKIAYDGTDFCGWQRQKNNKYRTVQEVIEQALGKIHEKPITLYGSGRTDTGVHAAEQIANFHTDIKSIPADRFVHALNSLLPQDVRIIDSCEVNDLFHSRFSAKMRMYRYQFLCRKGISLPHESRYNVKLHRYPRIDLLNAYGRILLGETDCTIFTAAGDNSIIRGKSKNRYIYSAYFYIEQDRLIFEICANAFMRGMVRSAAGTFLYYEEKDTSPQKLREIIAGGERSLAGPTLPPQGLFLWKVVY